MIKTLRIGVSESGFRISECGLMEGESAASINRKWFLAALCIYDLILRGFLVLIASLQHRVAADRWFSLGALFRFSLFNRQLNRDRAAAPLFALDRDAPAVSLDDLL